MTAEEKVSWLNEYASLRKWSVGDDVLCGLCGGVFKAEKALIDYVGDPTCPFCISSTPTDFVRPLPGRKP